MAMILMLVFSPLSFIANGLENLIAGGYSIWETERYKYTKEKGVRKGSKAKSSVKNRNAFDSKSECACVWMLSTAACVLQLKMVFPPQSFSNSCPCPLGATL